jgi:hypothetical protein
VAQLQLRPNEQVLYPQPYVENEFAPLIVTTLRVIWQRDPTSKKKKELDAAKLNFIAKGFHQRFVMLMLIFGLVGLPFLAFGAHRYYVYRDKPTEPPKVEKGQKAKPLTQNDLKMFRDNKTNFVVGIVTGVFGAALVGVAYLFYKRRLTVVVATPGKAPLMIPVKDAMTQDKLLTMINAAKTAAAAVAPMGLGGAGPDPGKVQKVGPAPPKLSK